MTIPLDLLREVLAAPDDRELQAVYSDLLEEQGRAEEAKLMRDRGWLPVTDLERKAVKALQGCRFLPGSWAKRFARDVCDALVWEPAIGMGLGHDILVAAPVKIISPKQYLWLWRLVWKYRKQHQRADLAERAVELLGKEGLK